LKEETKEELTYKVPWGELYFDAELSGSPGVSEVYFLVIYLFIYLFSFKKRNCEHDIKGKL